jgi:hypothetical protein
MSRSALTLIYVSRKAVVRADFASLRGGPEIHQVQRPDDPGLETAVELAFSLGSRLGRKVWVLATDCWTQTIGILSNRTLGLTKTELAGALNFEAELASGHSALESECGFAPIASIAPGMKGYWVTQIPTSVRERLGELVRAEGCQFGGVLHPGGVPVLQSEGPAARLELWPDTMLGISSATNGLNEIQIWNVDPSVGRRSANVEAWKGKQPEAPTTLAAESTVLAGDGLCLEDEASLRWWLNSWAGILSRPDPGVPVVRVPKAPLSAKGRALIAVGFAVLTTGMCGLHWCGAEEKLNQITSQVAVEKEKVQRIEENAKLLVAKQAEQAKVVAERKQLAETLEKWETRKARFAKLLDFLGKFKPGDILIQGIRTEADTVVVTGVTLKTGDADLYAGRLHDSLRTLGWDVQSPSAKSMMKVAEGGPWEFEIVIREIAPAPVTPAKGK